MTSSMVVDRDCSDPVLLAPWERVRIQPGRTTHASTPGELSLRLVKCRERHRHGELRARAWKASTVRSTARG